MDIVSHGVWGGVITRKNSILLGFIFGMLPDIIGMGGVWEWKLYLCSHSLIALVLVAVVSRIFFSTWLYAAAYGFHMFLDTFTHHSGTFPLFYVPFMWQSFDPIGFDGWNWWQEGLPIEIANITILLTILAIYFYKRKNHATSEPSV